MPTVEPGEAASTEDEKTEEHLECSSVDKMLEEAKDTRIEKHDEVQETAVSNKDESGMYISSAQLRIA